MFSKLNEASAAKRIKYMCKTQKKLVLKRVFLNRKLDSNKIGVDKNLSEKHQDPSVVLTVREQARKNKNIGGPSRAPSDI